MFPLFLFRWSLISITKKLCHDYYIARTITKSEGLKKSARKVILADFFDAMQLLRQRFPLSLRWRPNAPLRQIVSIDYAAHNNSAGGRGIHASSCACTCVHFLRNRAFCGCSSDWRNLHSARMVYRRTNPFRLRHVRRD